MSSRRSFLSKSIFSTIGLGLGLSSCETEAASPEPVEPSQNEYAKEGLPIVIATWKNEPATIAAWETMKSGGTALDAVEAGAMKPEADPKDQSVGYGGLPDREGVVTLDACIMDHEGNAGSVTFLAGIMHAISVARKVMEETPHVILSGRGAYEFAKAQGFETTNLLTPQAEAKWKKWLETAEYKPIPNIEMHDTIGILAIDAAGRISGACTTSGMAYKMHGRVGDSPVIGAGMYVDNKVGGACATGLGEVVLKTLGAFLIVELMRNGKSPQEACEEAVRRIIDRYADQIDDTFQVGYLAINKKGQHGAFSVVDGFVYTLQQGEQTQLYDSKSAIKPKAGAK